MNVKLHQITLVISIYLNSKILLLDSNLFIYPVVSLEPISNKNGQITSRVRERNRNSRPAEDLDASKAASSLVESKRWKVEKATDLIFHL